MRAAADLADEFRRTGILILRNAFSADAARGMQEAFWAFVQRHYDIRRDDPGTWPDGRGNVGLKQLRRSSVFTPFYDNPTVRHALDAVYAATGWLEPKAGTQILHTFPMPGPWVLPSRGWHIDCGFEQPSFPVSAVKLFGFFGEVGPGGGGTLLLSGSHRLVDQYRPRLAGPTPGNTGTWGQFMTQHPALAELYRGGNAADSGRQLLNRPYEVDGVEVEAIELTGQPGDVVITHLHTFHCAAPNAVATPRLMLGKPIYAVDAQRPSGQDEHADRQPAAIAS